MKAKRAHSDQDDESWREGAIAPTLNTFDTSPTHATVLAASEAPTLAVDERLPEGIDSNRYRCCGNGVVADVAEWIGWRLRGALELEP